MAYRNIGVIPKIKNWVIINNSKSVCFVLKNVALWQKNSLHTYNLASFVIILLNICVENYDYFVGPYTQAL